MKGQTTPMRIDDRTRRVINMIAAEYQLRTGHNWSANEALWQFLKEHRPDLVEKSEQTPDEPHRKRGKKNGEE